MTFANAGVLELADEVDSKSIGGDTVRVRPPPPAPKRRARLTRALLFFFVVVLFGGRTEGRSV